MLMKLLIMNIIKVLLSGLEIILIMSIAFTASAQLPYPVLVGYWHNWDTQDAPYVELDEVDSRYNVVNIAFGVPINGTDYEIDFTPAEVSQSIFIDQLQTLQSQGRKVLLSLGGALAPIKLDNPTERDVFISSVNGVISTYGFDGIDIDFEGSSLSVSGGTIFNPVDDPVIYLIDAILTIMQDYQTANNKKLLLTFAPETAFVQGGQSAYGSIWGAYLPVLHALRDSIDLLHVQLYNSGSMYGLDGNIYVQGTADFIIAMTEAAIQGFDVDRWSNQAGPFYGLPPEKVAIGLPACPNAAGGGFVDTATVASAVRYILGNGPKPGSYTLVNPNGYPTLAGMMTWSINWDNVNTCNNSENQFAENFERLFINPPLPVELHFFTATLNEHEEVELHWSTLSEINNDFFLIERSSDGIHWQSLFQQMGMKNSYTENFYSYIDYHPLNNQSYYRLKQVDLDGKFAYSPIVEINNTDKFSCSIYPNPTKDYMYLNVSSKEFVNLQLFNALGRIVIQAQVETNMGVSLIGLPKGIYYFVLSDPSNLMTYHAGHIVLVE